jgi:dimethylaniline monooxygenase (N-oxide forming)
LYKRIAAPGLPGLYFIGFINTTTGLPYAFEQQVKWLMPFETGEAIMPEEREMRDDIAKKKAWLKENYYYSSRMTLEEPHVFYFAELRQALADGKMRNHRSKTPLWSRVKSWMKLGFDASAR